MQTLPRLLVGGGAIHHANGIEQTAQSYGLDLGNDGSGVVRRHARDPLLARLQGGAEAELFLGMRRSTIVWCFSRLIVFC